MNKNNGDLFEIAIGRNALAHAKKTISELDRGALEQSSEHARRAKIGMESYFPTGAWLEGSNKAEWRKLWAKKHGGVKFTEKERERYKILGTPPTDSE